MSAWDKTVSHGVSVAELLCIALVVLKLTGHIDWPWLWVTAPAWVPLAVLLLIILVAALSALVDRWYLKKK